MRSENIEKLAIALVKVQSKLRGAVKDSENPYFKSSYADLSSVWDSIRLPLAENDLCVVQTTEMFEDKCCLVTTLIHSSGQWIDGKYPLVPVKNDPQALGSAMTYARRYALSALIGVVGIDDDAEAAMDRGRDIKVKSSHVAKSDNQVMKEYLETNGYDIDGIQVVYNKLLSEFTQVDRDKLKSEMTIFKKA